MSSTTSARWRDGFAARSLEAPRQDENALRLFLGSLSLTLGNPKVIVFFLALLPSFIDLASLTPARFALLAALYAVILPSVLLAYALAAGQARALFASVRAQRALNRGAGAMMAGVAAAVAVR